MSSTVTIDKRMRARAAACVLQYCARRHGHQHAVSWGGGMSVTDGTVCANVDWLLAHTADPLTCMTLAERMTREG